MSTMETFHARLSAASEGKDQYLKALASLAAMELDQLKALASDPGWQEWNSQGLQADTAA